MSKHNLHLGSTVFLDQVGIIHDEYMPKTIQLQLPPISRRAIDEKSSGLHHKNVLRFWIALES